MVAAMFDASDACALARGRARGESVFHLVRSRFAVLCLIAGPQAMRAWCIAQGRRGRERGEAACALFCAGPQKWPTNTDAMTHTAASNIRNNNGNWINGLALRCLFPLRRRGVIVRSR